MSIESGPKGPPQEAPEKVPEGEDEKISRERLPKSVEELLSATILDEAEKGEQLSRLYTSKREAAQADLAKIEQAVRDIETSR